MRVLISTEAGGAHIYDRMAFIKVLQAAGHDAYLWDITKEPAHDIFNRFKPEILITQLHNIDRPLKKCILNTPNLKVCAKAGNWGELDKDIDPVKFPILFASDEHKKTAEELQKAGKLDFVFVHYHPNQIERTMGFWKNIVKPIGVPNALDTFSYLGGENRPEFASDLNFLGGRWNYKAIELDKWLSPLCNPVGKHNIRIYGNSTHPYGQYVGPIQEENAKHLFFSSKINLDVSESHSYEFGFDVREKVFKIFGAGGFMLDCGYVASLHEDFFNGLKIPYTSKVEFLSTDIEYWLEHENAKPKLIKLIQNRILKQHTYFDRVCQMFNEFGLFDELGQVQRTKEKILGSI